jgi:hypothetical protein
MSTGDEAPPGETAWHSEAPQGRGSSPDAVSPPTVPAKAGDPSDSIATASSSGDAEAIPRPPRGFGKGVNDYLNHYVMVADAKAGAILAANLALGAALLDNKAETDPLWRFAAALSMLALSSLICMFVIVPRLPGGGEGPIFWEDIRKRGSLAVYSSQLRSLDDDDVEREYASQNWHVSRLLHKKFRSVQWAIGTFGLGVALSGWWAWGM